MRRAAAGAPIPRTFVSVHTVQQMRELSSNMPYSTNVCAALFLDADALNGLGDLAALGSTTAVHLQHTPPEVPIPRACQALNRTPRTHTHVRIPTCRSDGPGLACTNSDATSAMLRVPAAAMERASSGSSSGGTLRTATTGGAPPPIIFRFNDRPVGSSDGVAVLDTGAVADDSAAATREPISNNPRKESIQGSILRSSTIASTTLQNVPA